MFLVTETGIARCFDAKSGEVLAERRVAATYASPVLADGKLYCMTRSQGCRVLAADETLAVLGNNKLGDDSEFNASPAVSKGELFFRSDRALYCTAEAKP